MSKIIIDDVDNIQEFEIERVNFDDVSSVINYGQSVLETLESEIAGILEKLKTVAVPVADFRNEVDKLSTFESQLDEIEKKRSVESNKNMLIVKLRSLRNKIVKNNSTELTFESELENYLNNIDTLVDDVRKIYETSANDCKQFILFTKKLKPYQDALQKLYDYGVEDKASLEEEILGLEKQCETASELDENMSINSTQLKSQANLKRQLLRSFEKKLFSIQKNMIMIMNVIEQCNVIIFEKTEILMAYQDFLNTEKSMLKINAVALIGAKKQKEEVSMIEYLSEGANKALLTGQEDMAGMIESVKSISQDGIIKTNTIVEVSKDVKKLKTLLSRSFDNNSLFIEKGIKLLTPMIEEFNSSREETENQKLLTVGLIEDDELSVNGFSKRKKL